MIDDFAGARRDLIAQPGFGETRRRALTSLTDSWLADVFESAGAGAIGCALVAVGGYGRGELAPASDIDVILLHPAGVTAKQIEPVAERIWYPIWDAGLRLDHSVRTPAEARRLAGEDLRVVLGLLDARTVAGDDALTALTRSTVLGDWRAMARKRLDELYASVTERAERHGELAYLLEPDIKESHGGLRDLTVMRALAASWLVNPPQSSVAAAKATLLDVRDALHVSAARATDRLTAQEQSEVAQALGYADSDELLRSVCAAGRTISFVSSMSWYRVRRQTQRTALPRLRRIRRSAARAPLADGVVVQDGEVVLAADARPDRDPVLVLRAAAVAAQNGLRLAPFTVERLAKDSARLPTPWPQPARRNLVSLLGSGAAALPVWEALDQANIISSLLPGWQDVRSAPQRNPVHTYTVDRHLVQTALIASQYTRSVSRPDLLLVGALLHDIGKARGGDHTQIGMRIVAELGPQLGFDARDTAVLVKLVQLHLLLPEAATRRDIDDPAVIDSVAQMVGDADTLDLLSSLTVADAAATGPAAWSAWKQHLVETLVGRVRARLAGQDLRIQPALDDVPAQMWQGDGVDVEVIALADNEVSITVAADDAVGLLSRCAGVLAIHRLSVRDAASRTADGRAVIRWTVATQFGEPPAADALRADFRRGIAGEIDMAARLAQRETAYGDPGQQRPEPTVLLSRDASSRATVLEVRAHDRVGLLYTVASALAAAGLNVNGMKVSTLGSEVVDVFFLTDDLGRTLSSELADSAVEVVRRSLAR